MFEGARTQWFAMQQCMARELVSLNTHFQINSCACDDRSWNIRTLINNDNTTEKRTVLLGKELNKYGIDVAALSDNRFLHNSIIYEHTGN